MGQPRHRAQQLGVLLAVACPADATTPIHLPSPDRRLPIDRCRTIIDPARPDTPAPLAAALRST